MRRGACPCGTIGFAIDGPVRDVVVCHCDACREATGGPWPASAVRRSDLVVTGAGELMWNRKGPSEHSAARGLCRRCGTLVFWDAPGRETISFAVSTLADATGLQVAARIWVGANATATRAYAAGLPATVAISWRD